MTFNNIYRGERVWISGHTGFKGSWLSAWLLHLGAEVYGFSKDVPTQPSLFELGQLSNRLHHCLGDVRDLSAVKASEHQVILAAIQATDSRVEAAKKLGISPRTLRYKLAQLRERGMHMAFAD
jgi:nucleoside-diphosphate-sugar epimerase